MLRVFLCCCVVLCVCKTQAQSNIYWEKGNVAKDNDDMATCLKWYTLSADEEKNAKAAYYVGLIYEKNLAGSTDPQKSLHYYVLAGDLGNYEGYYEAAQYYHKKWIDETRFSELKYWSEETKSYFKKAAALGDPDANRKMNLFIKEEQDFVAMHEKNLRDQKNNETQTTPLFNGNAERSKASAITPKHKICSECHGTGKIHTTFTSPVKYADGTIHYGEYNNCSFCMGKGYLE
jgi:hypothetical protein